MEDEGEDELERERIVSLHLRIRIMRNVVIDILR